MANIELIKTDLQKENNGVWVDFAVGIRLKIARTRNTAYLELMQQLTEPYRKAIRESEIDLEILGDILRQVRAKTVLLGWENLEDKDGKSIEYNSEQALIFFRDLELRDFYSFVILQAENMENFKKVAIEEAEKNSGASSNGN